MNAQYKTLALLQKISRFSDKHILTDVRGRTNTEALTWVIDFIVEFVVQFLVGIGLDLWTGSCVRVAP